MNCRKFESQLEWLLVEKLPLALMQECRVHLESCHACRELLDLATQELIQIEPVCAEELVQAVLKRTSGKSCRLVHEMLPVYVDDGLETASRNLIEWHLKNCHSCQQIHQIMGELKEVMPYLAYVDPGNSFTLECMRAFGRLQNQQPQPKIWPRRLWPQLLVRPRLAWESAYILTLLFWVILKLFLLLPLPSRMEAISALQTKSAQFGLSMASTIKENMGGWSMSLSDQKDRWAKASSKSKEELFSATIHMTDRAKQYSLSASNILIQFPPSIWNGIVDKFEKFYQRNRPQFKAPLNKDLS